MTKPFELTASDALRAIRRRDLGVVEFVESLLDRIRLVEPAIGAWELVDDDGALARARDLEAAFTRDCSLPLFGLPIGLKDIYDTCGMTTTAGFPPWAQRVPDRDATTVERIRRAGAIVLGKTVTTQFAFSDPPRTRNPWHRERTPGGSSSGSAAAVAARMVPLALGTQTVGSILRPAAYCGVLGLKPTYGLVSRSGIFPLSWSFDHPGPIARSVEDLALALTILAGSDPRDPTTGKSQVDDYLAAVRHPGGAPTIGIVDDFFDAAEPDVQDSVAAAIEDMVRSGARVRHIRLTTSLTTVNSAHQIAAQSEAAQIHRKLFAEHPEGYGPRMRAHVEVGQLISGEMYLRAQRIRRVFRQQIDAQLRDVDCLMMPTASNVAPTPETTGDRSFQGPWSFIGYPAVTLPCQVNAGLPVGLQIVSGPWQEAKLLGLAAWAEERAGLTPSTPTMA